MAAIRPAGGGLPLRPRPQGRHDRPRQRPGASMSRYLIERIKATPKSICSFNTEVVALEGGRPVRCERVSLAQPAVRRDFTTDIRNLFLFVGADPATGWLDGCGVTLDRAASSSPVRNRTSMSAARCRSSRPAVPGVFAGRRCPVRLGEACRRRDRRGRTGGGGAARLSRRRRQACALMITARRSCCLW